MSDQLEQIIRLNINSWNSSITQANKLLAELSDDTLQKEIAPGKNSGWYLLGHLVAVHGHMIALLGAGENPHSELVETFIRNPDKSGKEKTAIAELRQWWSEVNNKLGEAMNAFTPAEWLNRHTSVSPEDFAKEPHRNKLNILLSRTSHLAYHAGQLALLKP